MARRNLYTPLSPDADHGSERKGAVRNPFHNARNITPNAPVRTGNQARTVARSKTVQADPTKTFFEIDIGAW